MLRRLPRLIRILLGIACAPVCLAQQPQPAPSAHAIPALAPARVVPGHLVIVYRSGVLPASDGKLASRPGARAATHLQHLGISTLAVAPEAEASTLASLSSDPQVALVLQDRYVTAHALLLRPGPRSDSAQTSAPTLSRSALRHGPLQPEASQAEPGYDSPQGWAVRQAGGYGANVPGGPPTGPWNASLGAGVRIAILDSGIDAHHPDIAPNLALNLSEVNQDSQSGLPSPCDDGSPQDQAGHGTWTASLAAGALGPHTGEVVGVAPQATLLNLKVLERMPADGLSDPIEACQAGQPGGLLSWVLKGIDDAVSEHADVIALSLGSLVDLSTSQGAGWKAAFDQAAYAATQSGAIIVAALGNDGLNLSAGTLAELPAQARGVLAITASTNPDCAENLAPNATCAAGPVTRPYYSNYGSTLSALAAPGGSYPQGATTPAADAATGWIRGACSTGTPGTTDGLPATGSSFGCFHLGHAAYVQAMGTSASAALAAGAAALLRAARPDLSASQLIAALRSSATHLNSIPEPVLNLSAAIVSQ